MRLTRFRLILLAVISCGPDADPIIDPRDAVPLYPAGYVLEVCRCRYRPPPEPPVRPWSRCDSAFKEVFLCDPELFWCPYQPWGWMCAVDSDVAADD